MSFSADEYWNAALGEIKPKTFEVSLANINLNTVRETNTHLQAQCVLHCFSSEVTVQNR